MRLLKCTYCLILLSLLISCTQRETIVCERFDFTTTEFEWTFFPEERSYQFSNGNDQLVFDPVQFEASNRYEIQIENRFSFFPVDVRPRAQCNIHFTTAFSTENDGLYLQHSIHYNSGKNPIVYGFLLNSMSGTIEFGPDTISVFRNRSSKDNFLPYEIQQLQDYKINNQVYESVIWIQNSSQDTLYQDLYLAKNVGLIALSIGEEFWVRDH